MSRLDRAFFARSALRVAPDLLGCRLVRELPDGARLEGSIAEVEAYLGDGSDAGSHSHRGPTLRNRAMFGPPGHFYVYLSHGLHFCANAVCEPAGSGAAVLIYVDNDAGDLHEHLNTIAAPLNTLGAKELSPGKAALEKINQRLR